METLGRYKLIRKIGAGGMAEVYLARAFGAQGIEKTLVLKRILPAFVRDAHFITMFVDEAQVASKLNHSNIVQIYSFEQIGRDYVLAMEYLDGPDLTKLVVACRRKGRLVPPEVAAYIVAEVAKGLDYAHNRRDEHGERLDIVHRDVSPQNILLSYDGAAKVGDFGIARARRLGEEGSGVIKGKFAYMSPEQAAGEPVDRRSDIFSLGVVLYEVLTGKPLFRGKPGSQVLEKVKAAKIDPPSSVEKSVPAELEAIVMKALAREPADRFQTAREMAGELGRYLHGLDQVVDATSLETLLREVLPRSGSGEDAGPEPGAEAGADEGALPTVAFQRGRSPRQTREKLNVVAVAGSIAGLEALKQEIGERRAAARVRELLRIVEEIGFKADAVVARQNEEGFLVYLGLPVSSVDDAPRAVRLALDVLDAGEGLSYDLPSPLDLGLGINRGPARVVRAADARVQDYEPMGTLVQVADRLAQGAGPGEIRVGGGIYRLCRRDFNFEELPALDISADPASGTRTTDPGGESGAKRALVFRLLGAKTRAERRREVLPEGALLGRDFELQQLRELHREVVAGNRARFVWVAGDMGIGKTRLVHELLARTETAGRRVIRADCTLAMRDISHGAVADLVRDACGIGEDDRPEAARTKLTVTLARLRGKQEEDARTVPTLCFLLGLPMPDGSIGMDESEDRKELVKRAVVKLVEGLSRSQPLAVVLENVHFADTPSLELLRELAGTAIERPVLVVALGRPEERLAPLLGGFRRIVLKQLREEHRVTLVQDRLGETDEARELARQICARTGGNPFFINEVIESLIDRGVVRFEGEDRRLRVDRRGPIQIPTTLEGVIAARIDELPPDERLLLRWASVAGLAFSETVLRELAGGDVRGPLERLVKRRILVCKEEREERTAKGGEVSTGSAQPKAGGSCASGIFGFRYPVMREVAYDGLVGPDRLQMHRRMAAMLVASSEGKPGPVSARIAMHLERAGDLEAAATRYLEAAAAARAAYSNRDALRFYARAITLLPGDSEKRFWAHEGREQILRGLSRRREQMGELDELRRIAQALREPALSALAYNRLARLYLDLGRLPLASKALAVALESARRGHDRGAEVEALRLLSVLAASEGHNRRALECCEQALTLVGEEKDGLKQRGTILLSRGDVLRQMGRLKDAVQSYAEALVIYRRLGIKRLQALTLNAMGLSARALGDYEDAVALLRRSLKLDQEINDRFRVGEKLCNLGLTYAEAGDLERAMKHLRRSAEVNQKLGDRKGLEDTLVGLSEVLLAAGARVEAETTLEQARKLAAGAESREATVRTCLLRADLALAASEPDGAAAAAREAAELAASSSMVACEAQAQVRLALAEVRRDRPEAAREALRAVESLLEQAGQVEQADALFLGLAEAAEALGDEAAAARWFARAGAEVEARLSRMKAPALRNRYEGLPRVRAVAEGCRRHPGDSRRVS